MTKTYRFLAVMALFIVVAAFAPAVHAHSTIASAYGSANEQHMTAYALSSTGVECRLVGAGGAPLGSAITVTTSMSAGNPAVAYDSVLDRFLVAWTQYDSDKGSFVVKARILESNGSLVGSEIDVGSDTYNQGPVKIAYSSVSGRYLVVFSQGPTGTEDIAGQFVNGSGSLYGVNFTALPGATYAEGASVAFDSVNDRFLVTAITRTSGNPPMSVHGTILNDDISVFKTPFNILDSAATYLYPQAIAYNPVTTQFLVVWEVYGGSGHQLWGQLVNADGTLDGTHKVIVEPWTVDAANDVVYQSDNGRFLVAWFDQTGGINGQEVSSDGTNYGSPFTMVNPQTQRDFALSYNASSKNTLLAYEISFTPYYTTFPPGPTLTVTKTGGGAVASDPTGISCGDGCSTASHGFSSGQVVTLTASTENGHVFDYWSGACEGTLPSCTVTMTGDLTVSATFVPSATKRMVLTVARSKVSGGDGTIQSQDLTLNCGPSATTCKNSYYLNTPVTLSAAASAGSTFTGWKPASLLCVPSGDCTVTMDKAKSVQAVFVGPQKLTVVKHNSDKGDGTVTSSPPGINCITGCPRASFSYLLRETVVLSAKADENSYFTGWSPTSLCGTGTGDCTVTMDKAKTVTANFNGPQALTVRKASVKKGTGKVTSAPAGIDCGDTCKGTFTYKSTVTLTAEPDPGFVFTGWSPTSLCGTGTGDCTVTMDKAKTVTAAFGVE